jgi:YD repeat-containing protein
VQIEPGGKRTSFTYKKLVSGAYAQQAEITAAGRTTYTYNSSDKLQAEIDPLGNRTTYIYAASGLRVASQNALNQRTTYVYNASGRNTAVVNPLNRRTTYT